MTLTIASISMAIFQVNIVSSFHFGVLPLLVLDENLYGHVTWFLWVIFV